MPFESKSQMRYMQKNMPMMAKKWAEHTSDMKGLPEKKKKSPKQFPKRKNY